MNEFGYPKENIRTEYPFSFGKARYRIDIMVFDEGEPYIVIELKNMDKKLLESAKEQLLAYVKATGAKYAIASNGITDLYYVAEKIGYDVILKKIETVPAYKEKLENLGTHSNKELIAIDSKRFASLLWQIADIYRGKFSTEETLKDIQRILTIKAFDEKSPQGEFRAAINENPTNVESRINALEIKAKKQYPDILKEKLKIKGQRLVQVVEKLQKISVTESANDGVGSKLKLPETFYYTGQRINPEFTTKLMISLLNLKKNSKFIDPLCGDGSLVIEAGKKGLDANGVEKDVSLANFAKVGLALSNQSGLILAADILRENMLQIVGEKTYDFLAIIPTFGEKIRDNRLNHFRLGNNRTSQSSEILYLESALRLLKSGGKMAIIVPEGFLFTELAYDARQYLLKESILKAIISLPNGAFSPFSMLKTSLLLLEKNPKRGTFPTDDVFVGILEDVNELNQVILEYNRYTDLDWVSDNPRFFVTKIPSARQMNADYLRRLLLMEEYDELGIVAKTGAPQIDLAELVDFTSGVSLKKVGQKDNKGSVRYIRAGDVDNFSVIDEKAELITAKPNVSKWMVAPDDILMTRAGTVGRVGLVKGNNSMVIGSNVVKLRIRDKTKLLPKYLVGYLSSKKGQNQIKMYVSGSTIKVISISGLKRLKIPVPTIAEQKDVVAQIEKVLKNKKETLEAIEKLKKQEKELLGELDDLF